MQRYTLIGSRRNLTVIVCLNQIQREVESELNADWFAPKSNGFSNAWSEFNGRLNQSSTLIGRILTTRRLERCEFVKLLLKPYITIRYSSESLRTMPELTFEEIYVYIFWRITVEFLKIVWLLYILFLIWLAIYYVNNFCIKINFVFN